MSSPQVAGSLLLLQELYKKRNQIDNDFLYMKSATLKALAIHTAEDRGNPGPDYTYGWGVLNTLAAAIVINNDSWQYGISTSAIIEDKIGTQPSTSTYNYALKASGAEDLRVTLVYTDSAKTVTNNGTGPALVNDLDLSVVQTATGWTALPYILDPNNPSNDATVGDNDLDNVEQVLITNPGNLYYVVRVTVEGSLANNAPQPFSLIITGMDTECHANIHHKLIDVPSETYTADFGITSEGRILPGNEVTYRTNGRVVLKPGFHAVQQTGLGTGFFQTTPGSCN